MGGVKLENPFSHKKEKTESFSFSTHKRGASVEV